MQSNQLKKKLKKMLMESSILAKSTAIRTRLVTTITRGNAVSTLIRPPLGPMALMTSIFKLINVPLLDHYRHAYYLKIRMMFRLLVKQVVTRFLIKYWAEMQLRSERGFQKQFGRLSPLRFTSL